MRKVLNCVLALIVSCVAAVSFGCGPDPVPNTPETLEMFVWDSGYGVEWAEDLGELFKQQQWVKDKYPNLVVAVDSNDQASYFSNNLMTPQKNTIDLFFANGASPFYHRTYGEGQPYIADISDVYDSLVPGEEVLYKEKIQEDALYAYNYTDPQGKITYKGAPWTGGYDGFLYNADHLTALEIDIPRTTDELVAANNKIKQVGYTPVKQSEKNYYSVVTTAKGEAAYWRSLFPIYWAQYEGYEGYDNFWQGIAEEAISPKIFSQVGRLESLKVIESVLSRSKGFVNPASAERDFKETQNRYLMGEGVFYFSGGWFYNEMKPVIEGFKEQGYDYNFKTMRHPIVSAIVDKAPSIKTAATAAGKTSDQVLSLIVKAVDEGKTFAEVKTDFAQLIEKDYKTILEARRITYSESPNANAIIPDYALGKEVAKDFLRFMATDAANTQYIKSTNGGRLPFKYNLKEVDKALYDSLPEMVRTKFDIDDDKTVPTNTLPINIKYPLSMYGGLLMWNVMPKPVNYEVYFLRNDHKSAEVIMQEEIDHWSTGSNWDTLRGNAKI